jgi:hypothetical protein
MEPAEALSNSGAWHVVSVTVGFWRQGRRRFAGHQQKTIQLLPTSSKTRLREATKLQASNSTTDSSRWQKDSSRPEAFVHCNRMQQSKLSKLLLAASICAALATVAPCHATATDSLPRDGDVIILSGQKRYAVAPLAVVHWFLCLACSSSSRLQPVSCWSARPMC